MDSFLSDAIARNRPRLVLFTPRDSPSLLYKLTAFAHQKTADFGFVTTVRGDEVLLQRFGVGTGEKRLAVLKEHHLPTSVMKVRRVWVLCATVLLSEFCESLRKPIGTGITHDPCQNAIVKTDNFTTDLAYYKGFSRAKYSGNSGM